MFKGLKTITVTVVKPCDDKIVVYQRSQCKTLHKRKDC